MSENKKEHIKKEMPYLVACFIWIMIINIAAYLMDITMTWMFCMTMPLFFLMSGNVKDKLLTVFLGGLTGIVITFIMCIGIMFLGEAWGPIGHILSLTLGIGVILLLQPFAPYFFNNVAFAYMVVCTVEAEAFCNNIVSVIIKFIIGGAIALGGMILVMNVVAKSQAKKA